MRIDEAVVLSEVGLTLSVLCDDRDEADMLAEFLEADPAPYAVTTATVSPYDPTTVRVEMSASRGEDILSYVALLEQAIADQLGGAVGESAARKRVLTEQPMVADVPIRKLMKVYFVRAEGDVVTDEGWITVDEAKRKNAQDRRAHGTVVNKYFEDKDSAGEYTGTLEGPELPEEPGPIDEPIEEPEPEPEPGMPEPEGELPELEPLEPEGELPAGIEPPLPPPGEGLLEPEETEEEVLEIEVPKKIRLRPTKESGTFEDLVRLEEQAVGAEPQGQAALPQTQQADFGAILTQWADNYGITMTAGQTDVLNQAQQKASAGDLPGAVQSYLQLAWGLGRAHEQKAVQSGEVPSRPASYTQTTSQQASKQREEPLDEQGAQTEYAPGQKVVTRGGKVLEVVRDVTDGDPFAVKRYLVKDETGKEYEVMANQVTPHVETEKPGVWGRVLGKGPKTRYPALVGESAETCPHCGGTWIENEICMNCRRKVEGETTEAGVIEALLSGDVDAGSAFDIMNGLDEKCQPVKVLKRAKKAAAKTYSREREAV